MVRAMFSALVALFGGTFVRIWVSLVAALRSMDRFR